MMRSPNGVAVALIRAAVVGLLLVWCRPLGAADATALANAEARLQAVYDQGIFRAARFRAVWLADSSGYLVDERAAGSDQTQQVMYLVASGERRLPDTTMRTVEQPDPRRSPDGARLVEMQAGNLIVRRTADGQSTTVVPATPGREIAFDAVSWSPDGRRIVFVARDQTQVRKRASLDDSDPSFPAVHHQRFARVGDPIAQVRVGIVDADGQHLAWIPLPVAEEGCYLGQVAWAGNADEVVIEHFSRFRDQRTFFLASTTGSLRPIFQEQNDAWVEASQGLNSGLTWIAGGRRCVVVSERDGWRHALVLDRDGKAVATLTPGAYDLIDRAAIDEQNGWYYFYASPDDATQRFLYRVPLDGSGTLERITPVDQPGTHHYDISPDCRWAIHTWSTINTPPQTEVIALPSHRSVRMLTDRPRLRERLAAIASGPVGFHRVDIGNGVTLDAWMLTPKEFDPARKYPVLVYVYGEPHSQTVVNEWGAAQIDFHRVIAELGYVVVSLDNRGTPAPKGAAWRRAVFGSLGPLSTEEQEAGLKALAHRHPFMDLSRVGIWGWSGGGSNTLNALFRKPQTYHVGIAVVPKPQPHLYNAWFQEIYMRTPEVNPEGYQRAAPINFAAGLAGRLLIITGSGETNTHIQIIEGLVDRLIELGKRFDYMVYPNRDHGLREGKGTVVHVRMLIARYLLANLPPGPR